MTAFINGKQVRARRPPTIDGMKAEEFIRQNAEPIWLHQRGYYEILHEPAMEEQDGPDLQDRGQGGGGERGNRPPHDEKGTDKPSSAYGYDAAGRLQYVHPAAALPANPAASDFTYVLRTELMCCEPN